MLRRFFLVFSGSFTTLKTNVYKSYLHWILTFNFNYISILLPSTLEQHQFSLETQFVLLLKLEILPMWTMVFHNHTLKNILPNVNFMKSVPTEPTFTSLDLSSRISIGKLMALVRQGNGEMGILSWPWSNGPNSFSRAGHWWNGHTHLAVVKWVSL